MRRAPPPSAAPPPLLPAPLQVLSQDMGLGSLWATSLQACLTLLICCHGAALGLGNPSQPPCPRAWASCQLQLYALAAHPHPLVQHMAGELLGALLANGEPGLAEQQLRALCQLLKVVAGVESLAIGGPGAGCELGRRLSRLLGRLLQVRPLGATGVCHRLPLWPMCLKPRCPGAASLSCPAAQHTRAHLVAARRLTLQSPPPPPPPAAGRAPAPSRPVAQRAAVGGGPAEGQRQPVGHSGRRAAGRRAARRLPR
jgi:hypothetical protein